MVVVERRKAQKLPKKGIQKSVRSRYEPVINCGCWDIWELSTPRKACAHKGELRPMRDISGGKEHSMTGLTGRFLVKGRAVEAAVLWNRFMYYLLWLMLFWKPFFWSANTNGDLIWSNACRISMDQTAEQVLTFVKVYLASSCARVGRSFIERGFGGTGPQSCPKKSQQKPHPVKCKRDYKRKTYLYTTVYLFCCFLCLSCCAVPIIPEP